jgi:hypothetical protein
MKKKIKFIHTSSFRPRRPLQNQLNVEGARCSTGGASEDDDCAEKGLERKARGREGLERKTHCREGAGEIELKGLRERRVVEKGWREKRTVEKGLERSN